METDVLRIAMTGFGLFIVLSMVYVTLKAFGVIKYFKKEKVIISGDILKITKEEYNLFLQTTPMLAIYGVSYDSVLPSVEMIHCIVEVESEGKVFFVKLNMTKVSFERMNLRSGTTTSLSCHKRKWQDKYVYDDLL